MQGVWRRRVCLDVHRDPHAFNAEAMALGRLHQLQCERKHANQTRRMCTCMAAAFLVALESVGFMGWMDLNLGSAKVSQPHAAGASTPT